jgi:hypothetical protein
MPMPMPSVALQSTEGLLGFKDLEWEIDSHTR